MEIILTGFFLILSSFYKKYYKKTVTAFTIIIGPYVVITVLNNFIATKFGFRNITQETMVMIAVGILFFFFGSIVENSLSSQRHSKKVKFNEKGMTFRSDKHYFNIKRIYGYVWIVLVIRISQLAFRYRSHGLAGLVKNDFEMFVVRGPVAHLLVSAFPFVPILFYNWLIDKKKNTKYLIPWVLYVALAFVETEKAQVISIIIATFLFCVFKNEKYIKKGLIILTVAIPILFIANYVIKLTLQGYASHVESVYYTYRLWNYIAGGIINSDQMTSGVASIGFNGFVYFATIFLIFPNMILNRILGISIKPELAIPYLQLFPAVTYNLDRWRTQTGNVVTSMTYMFANGNWFAFIIVTFIWGFISEYVFTRMYKNRNDYNIILCNCYLSFSILSFFGSYYITGSFMERIIWCIILSSVFKDSVKFILHR